MKSFLFIIMLILVAFSQSCTNKQTLSPSEQEKLDPFLQQLLVGEQINYSKYSMYQEDDGTVLYGVIIHAKDIDEIKKTGIHFNSIHGSLITAKLTPEEIRDVVNLNSVHFIENPKKNYPH